ncbi:MAG: FAD-binding oxidoreductase, partial [Myxococcales bacterium]|nr:FAD-binding oxidoreductase [Myxococcales bacterium]
MAEYGQNVSGLASTVEGVIRPADAGQVQQIVRACRVAGRTLYPISRGGNWGMGSRRPVQHGLVLDLQRMNRIREVDRVHGVAVVEPGVTQQ